MTLSSKKLAEMRVRVEKSMAYGSDLNAMLLAADNMELQTAVKKLRDALVEIKHPRHLKNRSMLASNPPQSGVAWDLANVARAALLEVFGPSE